MGSGWDRTTFRAGNENRRKWFQDHDWARTALGPASAWPSRLVAAVDLMLDQRLAMAIFWGKDHLLLCNSSFGHLLGDRLAGSLGRPLHSLWPGQRLQNEALLRRVLRGRSIILPRRRLPVVHDATPPEARFDLSLSPLRNDAGAVDGVLLTAVETTDQVQALARLRAARRQQTYALRLSDALRPLADPAAVMAEAAGILGRHLRVGRVAYGEVQDGDTHILLGRNYVTGHMPQLTGLFRMGDFGPALVADLTAGRTVAIPDIAAAPGLSDVEKAAYATLGIQALVGVPLIKDGHFIAILSVHEAAPRDWKDPEISLIEETAERTWAALGHARAEGDLAKREALFRSFAENSAHVLWISPANHSSITYLSPSFDRIFGTDQRKVVEDATLWRGLVHPDDIGTTMEASSRLVKGQTVTIEYRITRPRDGSLRRIQDTGFPVRNAEGQITHVAGIATDVTDQRAAEAALRLSEEQYRVLFDSIDEGFCLIEVILGPDGAPVDYRLLEANAAFDRQTGLGDVAGGHLAEFVPGMAVRWIETLGRVALTGESIRFSYDSPLSDRSFDFFAARVGNADSRKVAVVFNDITERKRSERAMQAVAARQSFLLRLSDALRQLGDPVEIQRAASLLLGEFLGLDRCGYAEVDQADGSMTIHSDFQTDPMASWVGSFRLDDLGPRIVTDLRQGQTLVVEDFSQDQATADPLVAARYEAAAIRAAIVVPLVKEDRLVAILFAHQGTIRPWLPDEVSLIEEVAERTWAVVERAQTEVILRAREESLRAILENARDYAILTTDADGLVETWSTGAEEVLGWTADEIIGQPIDITFTPEDRAAGVPATELDLARSTGQAPDVRWHMRKDGVRVFIDGAVRPLVDSAGVVRGFVKVGQDVTERRATQERLRASEALFRQFAETSPDVIWIRDAETLLFDYVSPAFATVYGTDIAEMQGRNDLDAWNRLIVPEDRDSALTSIRRVRFGESVTHEFRILRPPDGEIRWVRDTTFPLFDAEGRVERVAGIGQDVTDLKRAEAAEAESARRFRTLAEGIPQLVWRSAEDGNWTWASPQWCAYTGQTEAQSRGWGWLDPVHPEDRAGSRSAWADAATTGLLQSDCRIRDHASDSYRWFQTRAVPVHAADGTIVEWLGTSTDVQDLHAMRDRLSILVAELQHRTRNLMAVISAVTDRTFATTDSMLEFKNRIRSRFGAISRASSLLSRLDWNQRITFAELLQSEFLGHGIDVGEGLMRITLHGPEEVRLRSSSVQTLALALHELLANALTLGALSAPEGQLAVEWQVSDSEDSQRHLRVDWTETSPSGGPRPDDRQAGFARELIERALPYQFGASTRYDLLPHGLHCRIDLPISPPADPD